MKRKRVLFWFQVCKKSIVQSSIAIIFFLVQLKREREKEEKKREKRENDERKRDEKRRNWKERRKVVRKPSIVVYTQMYHKVHQISFQYFFLSFSLSLLSCYFIPQFPFLLRALLSPFLKREKIWNLRWSMISLSLWDRTLELFFLFISSFCLSHLSFLSFHSHKNGIELEREREKEKEKNLEEDASYHILPSFSFHFPKESSKGFYVKIFHPLFLLSYSLPSLLSLSLFWERKGISCKKYWKVEERKIKKGSRKKEWKKEGRERKGEKEET